MINENLLKEVRIKFGLLFKDLRLKKGLTQQQIADFCEVSFQTINKVEQGKFPYSVDLLLKLSVILEFTINFEQKETGKPSRFLLQKSQREGFFSVTDTENQIVCIFEQGKFNQTQKISFLNDSQISVSKIATIMRELGDWLNAYHSDILA